MSPGISEVMAAVKAQGIGPTGPWFAHHLKMDPATFDFEICVPVTAPVSAVSRVVGGEVPVVRVARTTYHGPYEGLGAAWGEFGDWIAANGHTQLPDLYECYVAGPSRVPIRSTGAPNSVAQSPISLENQRTYRKVLKTITSPSCTMYSLPSVRTLPNSRARA